MSWEKTTSTSKKETLNSKKKILDKINSLNEKFYSNTKVFSWTGNYDLYDVLFAVHLSKKYNDTIMFSEFSLTYYYYTFQTLEYSNMIDIQSSKKFMNKLITFIRENISKRFIIIPIGLVDHSNLLVIDTKNKEIELFDAHGSLSGKMFNGVFGDDFYKDYLKYTETFIKNIMGSKYKFFNPIDFFSEGENFQIMEIEMCPAYKYSVNSEGFCLAWAYFYIEMRLKNKNIDRKTLVKYIVSSFKEEVKSKGMSSKDASSSKTDKLICKTIRSYSLFLKNLKTKTPFLKKLKIYMKIIKLKYINIDKIKYYSLGFILAASYLTLAPILKLKKI